ncbi:Peroxisomal membrane protein PMP22 [Arabidopsis thaliana]|uniref:Peroxisomal membrane protein PMP22 n=5 Tax=Arabidopsis TaxID=3701 RepID=PMP22_ARATH|nr:Peroxisomal membrane 22 kDa (Mpv17/PMP22) family protein [Arabidopsis thaliana]NP_192356.1 Peroxisomal membrane 22 kDa (Mpv17/PMP22) family protein [Arabidopsis thaliana]Q9ZS51.1 RecName: Full=Peroxisomal membrane protein PMP22; AltName: Full=22 kDa peroxisomal membrane protein [Arabidopsis thaliana]KAG7615146.1 Mpv17/PMP22 [Arabidopsis thaliana x Arabidopsis arenosa]KAG7619649.1 Mpv17/PMP22 [Arabidopsis suecica]AAD29759.1 pmp22 peroxisomal membrane protein [Arabidopsis thaliana]AAO23620.1|eukprot:NP_001319865.1 Peroxisomal membrane 22 kDa (Mpv17/PMP22) family protein [Arabidopsis thaliana]
MGSSPPKKTTLQRYLSQLQQHPLRTKAITAGVLSGVSDVVSQKLSGIQKIQLRRVLLKVIFAGGFLGPAGHFFHTYLDKFFKGKKDTQTVAKKVILEQLTLSPLNHLLFMIYYGVVIERTPWTLVRERIKKTYPTVQLTAWTFFPVVGWINYKYVPLHFRVILHSLVAFFWGIFLTLRARSMTLALAKAK